MIDYDSLSNEELMKIAGIGSNQPLSVRNNNPGNLRPLGADKGFQSFESPQAGIDAMYRDLQAKVSGNSNAMKDKFREGYTPTIETVVSTWAPPTENNTAAYINAVSKGSGIAPNQPLGVDDVARIVPAMIKHEGGNKAVEYYNMNNVVNEIDYDSMSNEELMKIAGIEPQPTVKQKMQSEFEKKKSFAQDVGSSFKKRQDMVTTIRDAYTSGEQSLPETALQMVGKGVAGLVNDVAGSTLAYGASAVTPDFIEEPIKQGIGNAVSYISDSAAGDVLRDYAGSYGDFEKNNPRLSRNIDSVVNIGSIAAPFVPVKGTSVAGSVVDAAGDTIEAGAKQATRAVQAGAERLAVPRQVMPNSEQLAAIGSKVFNVTRASGETFAPASVANKFVLAIDNAKPKKIGGVVETDLSQSLESGLGKYRDIFNKPLGIDEVDIIDKDIGNLKDQAYSAGKNQLASEYASIQNALRQSVADSPAGQALAQGRDMFRRKYQMEDVERIFRNAEGRPNEAAIIQTGYRNLANQARKKGSGYTKEQIALMDKAAKGGFSIDALKLLSSKLIPVVAGASGNVAGAGVAYMGNLAAGAGATALQTAKANKLAKSITKGITVESEPTLVNRAAAKLVRQASTNPTVGDMKRMTPEQAQAIFESIKRQKYLEQSTKK